MISDLGIFNTYNNINVLIKAIQTYVISHLNMFNY